MSAPQRKPKYFDVSDPDGPGLFPYRATTWLIDRLHDEAMLSRAWRVSSKRELAISIVAHQPGKALRLAFETDGRGGVLTLAPEASGWLTITVTLAGAEVFRGYLDQPHDGYEIWPQGASGAGAAPGRAGERRDWVDLSVAAWPGLAALEIDGVVRLEAVAG